MRKVTAPLKQTNEAADGQGNGSQSGSLTALTQRPSLCSTRAAYSEAWSIAEGLNAKSRDSAAAVVCDAW